MGRWLYPKTRFAETMDQPRKPLRLGGKTQMLKWNKRP